MEDTCNVLEESKAYTNQALASVAYQINRLARDVLRLLDTQVTQLKKMESCVHVLTQVINTTYISDKILSSAKGRMVKCQGIHSHQKLTLNSHSFFHPFYPYFLTCSQIYGMVNVRKTDTLTCLLWSLAI